MRRLHNDNLARDPPYNRKFYHIELRDDGLVDIYLMPIKYHYDADCGLLARDVNLYVIHGVVPWKDIEDDIRERFESWCKSAIRLDIRLA